MKINKYKWLLFDVDDTLFDFEKTESNALIWTLKDFEIEFNTSYPPLYAKYNQQVWQEFERGELSALALREKRFRLFFDALSLDIDISAVSRQYLANLARGTDLIEGALEVINYCTAEKIRVALVTNGLAEVQLPRLKNSKLNNCFEKIFISEQMGFAKPSIEFFEQVFSNISQPSRSDVMIIGDSISSDIKGGIDFGIDTCWFNQKGSKSDLPMTYSISKLIELLPILKQ
ncbi:MAG: YjjG family noncanonical pyrimidine nucleotidase [Chloroflexota bacterium]